MNTKYTHAIILDFEATCQEGAKPKPQEIIEFPSVLISLETKQVVDEFQSFVRPFHHPVLSEFCTNLTSITQDDVDNAELFPVVLEKHLAWLKSHGLNENNALFVTCGDWDFNSGFTEQCAASEPMVEVVPPIYRKWQNIKIPFCQYKGCNKAPGMSGMLRELDIPLIGHHHRGIDDCRNIANLYIKLLENGASPEQTKTLKINKYPPIRVKLQLGEKTEIALLTGRNTEVLKNLAQKTFKTKILQVNKADGKEIKSEEDFANLEPLEVIILNNR